MLNRPAFFALLGAAGIAAVGYGCQLEDREPPAPNPRPGGGNAVVAGVGPGGTGANGGGGNGGEGVGTTTTGGGGGGGGDGGGGGVQTPAEQLFPFCGCLDAGAEAGCGDCLWNPSVNLCTQEALNCDSSADCVELRQAFADGICPTVDPMCLESVVGGLEPGVGTLFVYLQCACPTCSLECSPQTACQ